MDHWEEEGSWGMAIITMTNCDGTIYILCTFQGCVIHRKIEGINEYLPISTNHKPNGIFYIIVGPK